MNNKDDSFEKLKNVILKEKKIIEEMEIFLINLDKLKSDKEKEMILNQLAFLEDSLKKTNSNISSIVEKISIIKPLSSTKQTKEVISKPLFEEPPPEEISTSKLPRQKISLKDLKFTKLESRTLKRLKEKEEKASKKRIKKPSKYVEISNKIFSNFSKSLIDQNKFTALKKDLIEANLQFIPISYVSMIFFNMVISFFIACILFTFFLFFNFGANVPIITRATENVGPRFLKVFWILFVIPIGTFLISYLYPSLEKKASASEINQELPFATIHMAAISGSMLDPSKIFSIIILTEEYPYLEREFVKLINQINIYGFDLVSALRSIGINSPSKKLRELLHGLATTITSGGDLPEFFDKRSQTLLFEHRIEREKNTKSAETFMDIYISVVIAAPMILMLLLMMMKISGLGLALSTSMISLIMVLGVTVVNIAFLVFLQLKQPAGG